MGTTGSKSFINTLTVEELVELMLKHEHIVKNVRLYQQNDNMNADTRAHATAAYKAFLKRKAKDRAKAKAIREEQEKVERIQKYKEKYPLSFRYRNVEEIYKLIREHKSCFNQACDYVAPSRSNSRLDKELIERTRKALVRYYKKHNRNSPKLKKLLERDPKANLI